LNLGDDHGLTGLEAKCCRIENPALTCRPYWTWIPLDDSCTKGDCALEVGVGLVYASSVPEHVKETLGGTAYKLMSVADALKANFYGTFGATVEEYSISKLFDEVEEDTVPYKSKTCDGTPDQLTLVCENTLLFGTAEPFYVLNTTKIVC
jgi:hypothetical protein